MQGIQAPRRATVAAALCAALSLSALVVLDASRRAAVASRHRSTLLSSRWIAAGEQRARVPARCRAAHGAPTAVRCALAAGIPANSAQDATTDWLPHMTLAAGRRTQLWDLEEGGPTDADQGFNYNPVVLDDAVSRRGYPALVTGWREWGCDGDRESLETEWECVNHPDNHGADYDDDYFFDSYGRGGRFTGHFTEDLDI